METFEQFIWKSLPNVTPAAPCGLERIFFCGNYGDPVMGRGTKWQIILKNMRGFFAAGGSAEWDFIVFRHNEHQVDAARASSGNVCMKNVATHAAHIAARRINLSCA